MIEAATAARVLRGAWRATPPPCDVTAEDLAVAAPLLLRSGSAALAWHRIRREPALAESPAGVRLHEAYRLHSLQHAVMEQRIIDAVTALRASGIDPILIKGWDCARLYPSPGMRPFGDVDLWPDPADTDRAYTIVDTLAPGPVIDLLHLEAEGPEEHAMRSRTRTAMLRDTPIRVLAPEDHLRLLAIHFVKHGGWRPIWLADLAALIETHGDRFDWDACLPADRIRREWVQCAIAIAGAMLGAKTGHAPLGRFETSIPGWITDSVRIAWGKPNPSSLPALPSRRHPIALAKVAATRWPTPLEVTYRRRRSIRRRPPLSAQASDFTRRALKRIVLPRHILERG